jgi:hypothetical protein
MSPVIPFVVSTVHAHRAKTGEELARFLPL